jgi:hypothetical protein
MVDVEHELGEILQKALNLQNRVKKFLPTLSNKSFDLETRWEWYSALVESGALNNVEYYGDGLIHLVEGDLNLHDDFHIERSETTVYPDFYQYSVLDNERTEDWTAWREAVLASGYYGFTWDW